MLNYLVSVTFFILCFFLIVPPAHAEIENPLSVPNNKIGIHVLFDSELQQASELVNSNGGDWGYVLIPIQSNDRDKAKWQRFMANAKRLHLIPILRLSTESDPANTQVWRKPTSTDVVSFAQFLNSLNWPVQNRYVIVFNEVNRGDEWGGSANPTEYAQLLSFAVTVFKSKDPNFFMISGGMDNAAPSQGTKYMNQYDYLRQMQAAIPNVFQQVDGISSHSYPNPGFSQPPETTSLMGTGSFQHEKELIKTFSSKDLPVFITETGWDGTLVPDDKRAEFYQTAMNTVWNDPSIVTVIPFLLHATGGPFERFTFLNADGSVTKQYEAVKNLTKIKGMPKQIPVKVLAAKTEREVTPKMEFEKAAVQPPQTQPTTPVVHTFMRWMLGI